MKRPLPEPGAKIAYQKNRGVGGSDLKPEGGAAFRGATPAVAHFA